MKKVFRLHSQQLLFLSLIVVGSNFVVKYFFDLTFDYTQLSLAWQLLDVQLLKTKLIESLWYLHSQPPLFNLFAGIILQVFPHNYAIALEYTFKLFGLLQSLLLYLSLYRLSNKKSVAFVVATSFALLPSFLLYENWFFYTFIAMCGLSCSVFLLIQFLKTNRVIWAIAFFSCLAILCLTISMFHLVWLILIIILCLKLLKGYRTKIIVGSLFPLLLVTGWYTKNLILFDHFTSSTWTGMNISRIMLPISGEPPPAVTNDTLCKLIETGSFKCLSKYQPLLPHNTNYPAIAAVQQTYKSSGGCNYNNIQYIYLSEKFQQASVAVFRYDPRIYFRNAITSNILYFAPASNYFYLATNRQKLGWYDRLFNFDLTPVYKSYIGIDNFILILLYICVFFSVSLILRRNYKENKLNTVSWKWQDVTVIFAAFNILFFLVIGNFFELGESNRFRFQVTPLLLVMTVYSYTYFKKSLKKIS